MEASINIRTSLGGGSIGCVHVSAIFSPCTGPTEPLSLHHQEHFGATVTLGGKGGRTIPSYPLIQLQFTLITAAGLAPVLTAQASSGLGKPHRSIWECHLSPVPISGWAVLRTSLLAFPSDFCQPLEVWHSSSKLCAGDRPCTLNIPTSPIQRPNTRLGLGSVELALPPIPLPLIGLSF